MKIKGTVKVVFDTEEVGSRGFKKRILVVTTPGEYPQHIPIEFVSDKVNLLDDVAENEEVEVSIKIQGREWNGKYFSSIQGLKIDSEL
jgi:hypothetical protein